MYKSNSNNGPIIKDGFGNQEYINEPNHTPSGRHKVIDTTGYNVGEGFAAQITLPNGKYYYTGHGSILSTHAEEIGLKVKVVRYFGACIYCNINDRAHDNFPIQIDEVDIKTFIDKVATKAEGHEMLSNYNL